MQNPNLPTKSEIYKPRNIQYEQSFIQMNIYKPPPKNNDLITTQTNENVNQTEENLFKNNNQLSIDEIRDNSNNYPLTENRNRNAHTDAIIVEKTTVFYKSVNPNMNNVNKGNFVQNNVDNMAYQQQNVGVVGVVQNQPQPQIIVHNYCEPEEKTDCEDIVCCILLIIYYLYCFVFIILFYIIACVFGCETEDSCFYCCIHGLCFKRKKRRSNKCCIIY